MEINFDVLENIIVSVLKVTGVCFEYYGKWECGCKPTEIADWRADQFSSTSNDGFVIRRIRQQQRLGARAYVFRRAWEPYDTVRFVRPMEGDCYTCREVKYLRSHYPAGWDMQTMVYSHGLNTPYQGAFVSTEDGNYAIRRGDMVLDGVGTMGDICCTQPGASPATFGLLVRGIVSLGFQEDIASYINQKGERVAHSMDCHGSIETRDEAIKFARSSRGYGEFHVSPKEIIGFWVNESALTDPEIQEMIEHFRGCGLKMFVNSKTFVPFDWRTEQTSAELKAVEEAEFSEEGWEDESASFLPIWAC